MKLTPFAKLFITLVILAAVGYTAWHFQGSAYPQVGGRGAIREPGATRGLSGRFRRAQECAAGPVARDGLHRCLRLDAGRHRQAEPAARGGNQHLGRALAGNRVQQRSRSERRLQLQAEVRHGREVRIARGPGREAGGVSQRQHRHHVGHGRQLGARSVDPRGAASVGEIDHHARLVERRRRHRFTGVDQFDRTTQGSQDSVHAVHAVALPAAVPAVGIGPEFGGSRSGREGHHFHAGCAGSGGDVQGETGRRGGDLGTGPFRGRDGTRG